MLTLAVGSTSERHYEVQAQQMKDRLITDARQSLPELKSAKLILKWAGLRPQLIPRPYWARILFIQRPIANGGFKIGLGMRQGSQRSWPISCWTVLIRQTFPLGKTLF